MEKVEKIEFTSYFRGLGFFPERTNLLCNEKALFSLIQGKILRIGKLKLTGSGF